MRWEEKRKKKKKPGQSCRLELKQPSEGLGEREGKQVTCTKHLPKARN